MASTPKKSAADSVTKSTRGDLAAKRKAELDAEHAAERAAAAEHMSLATASAQHEADSTIANYTNEPVSEEEIAASGATQVEQVDPTAPDPALTSETLDLDADADDEEDDATPPRATEIVRPREDCRFTFGAGNEYRFSAGRAAKVPVEVAQHMREKGLIWD